MTLEDNKIISSKKRGAPIGNQRGLKHGMWGTSEYKIWDSMIQRCRCSKKPGYKNYGGRGINVCIRWKNFSDFYADMGNRPSPKHTLDRIDNNGNYCPENCKWSTYAEQSRNKRNNRIVEYKGQEYCFIDLANKFGLNFDTLSGRLKLGWSLEKALHEPTQKLITYKGETKSIVNWAKDHNMAHHVLYNRVFVYNWPVEKALTIPVKQHKLLITYKGETKALKDWSKQYKISIHTLGRRLRDNWSVEKTLTTPVRQLKSHKKAA